MSELVSKLAALGVAYADKVFEANREKVEALVKHYGDDRTLAEHVLTALFVQEYNKADVVETLESVVPGFPNTESSESALAVFNENYKTRLTDLMNEEFPD